MRQYKISAILPSLGLSAVQQTTNEVNNIIKDGESLHFKSIDGALP
jgi:hypothetical protein